RPVAEVAGERRRGGGVGAAHRQGRRGQVDVVLEQARVGGAGLVDLGGAGPGGVAQAVDALPHAVEVVEAVVLLVDHHDVVDPRQPIRTGGGGGGTPGWDPPQGPPGEQGQDQPATQHNGPPCPNVAFRYPRQDGNPPP